MKIKRIELSDYRNYQSVDLSPRGNTVIVSGNNAVGKTNLLESVYICAVGKSPRSSLDKNLIRWGAERFYVKLTVSKKYRDHTIELYLDDKNKKKIAVDGLPLTKMGELMGVLNVIYFSPDELKLIKAAPAERRRFMDISLCQQNRAYYFALSRYNKILAQRNKLLKSGVSARELNDTLPLWDKQMAAEGALIARYRFDYIRALAERAARYNASIAGSEVPLRVGYESGVFTVKREDIENYFMEKLAAARAKDIETGSSSVGIQHDDVKIFLGDTDLRKFGSQGQQRTAVLSIKLAEIETIAERTGENPVLLLDDVLSELDENRVKALMRAVKNAQTFITCTEYYVDDEAQTVGRGSIESMDGRITLLYKA